MMDIALIALLALNCYHEARGECFAGQKAVCHVVLNRMAERNQTAEQVIYANHQFSWTITKHDNVIRDYESFSLCVIAANQAVVEHDNGYHLLGANHYYNKQIVNPAWAENMTNIIDIGNHSFYKGQ